MTTIRPYRAEDAPAVGVLIADTFRTFNLSYAPASEQELLLGPFRHARSAEPEHRQAIASVVCAPVVLVATEEHKLVGVLRGSPGRLHSLFVDGRYHGRGIGRALVEQFEDVCRQQGTRKITLASSLYAVPFYQHLGYRRSTGVRYGPCFDGAGLPTQPMLKHLHNQGD